MNDKSDSDIFKEVFHIDRDHLFIRAGENRGQCIFCKFIVYNKKQERKMLPIEADNIDQG